MEYKKEQVAFELDIIEVTDAEYFAGNEMFKNALKNRHPELDLSKINYNTVIITDGTYRVEFRVKKKSYS